jgi:hypothetical protein
MTVRVDLNYAITEINAMADAGTPAGELLGALPDDLLRDLLHELTVKTIERGFLVDDSAHRGLLCRILTAELENRE